MQWVETLWNFKNFDDVISNSKECHNRHFDVAATQEVKSLHCFFLFGWIKLKFGVRVNFRLLISNLNSKTQYRFEILRKCHFSSLRSWFLAQHSLLNWSVCKWNVHRTVSQLNRSDNGTECRVQCSIMSVTLSRNLEAINYQERQTDVLWLLWGFSTSMNRLGFSFFHLCSPGFHPCSYPCCVLDSIEKEWYL